MFEGFFHGIAYHAGRLAGHGKKAVVRVREVKRALDEAVQRSLVLYCFTSFGVHLLRLTTAGHVLPAEADIRKRFRNVFPGEAADILAEVVAGQKHLPDMSQIAAVCDMACQGMTPTSKHDLLKLLIAFSRVGGAIESEELAGLRWIAGKIGIEQDAFGRLLRECVPNVSIVDKNSFYEILGIDKSATADEIRKAYRRMAAVHHPDRFTTGTAEEQRQAHHKFIEINNAFQRLKS